jgi:hypothetical protein
VKGVNDAADFIKRRGSCVTFWCNECLVFHGGNERLSVSKILVAREQCESSGSDCQRRGNQNLQRHCRSDLLVFLILRPPPYPAALSYVCTL